MKYRTEPLSRRALLSILTIAGAAGLVGLRPTSAAGEPPPETTRLRLGKAPFICIAPQYLAEEFLPAEGFTDVRYVNVASPLFTQAILAGDLDIGMNFSGPLLTRVDTGDPIVILGGAHVGCFELFASDRVRAIPDLKGKAVGVTALGGPDHVFLASMVAYVGLDARKDITWAPHSFEESSKLLAEGRIDAVMAFPPQPQELRAKRIGHVVVNSMMDQPWSNYFCCMAYTSQNFVQKYPVATKRALRAILKAADLCTREPERAARFLVEKGYTTSYDYALQTMTDVIYKWREYDPEDTLRFYALRLEEAGMVKSTPNNLIARGTDWRFLNELKKELKG